MHKHTLKPMNIAICLCSFMNISNLVFGGAFFCFCFFFFFLFFAFVFLNLLTIQKHIPFSLAVTGTSILHEGQTSKLLGAIEPGNCFISKGIENINYPVPTLTTFFYYHLFTFDLKKK